MKTETTSHLIKTSGTKRDAKRHCSVSEDLRPAHQPYKKPKTNFKHYVEQHLDDDDFDEWTH